MVDERQSSGLPCVHRICDSRGNNDSREGYLGKVALARKLEQYQLEWEFQTRQMTTANKPDIRWTNVEAGLAAMALGLILFAIGWQSAVLSIIAGFLAVIGGGYLLSVPEVRFYFKLTINWASRTQVFKDVSISGSIVASAITADRGGTVYVQQGVASQQAPFLRIVPTLYYVGKMKYIGGGFDWIEFWIEVTNIGDGIATDIRGQVEFVGAGRFLTLQPPTDGKFDVPPLGPKESTTIRIAYGPPDQVSGQKSFSVVLAYKDRAGKEIPASKVGGQVSDLKLNMV